MLTLKQWMEAVDYRISEGSDYLWNCYGRSAYRMDSWNGEHDGYSFSIVFDTKTQVVYESTAYDYKRNRAYRLMNSDYVKQHQLEVKEKGQSDTAWELEDGTPLPYIDLETVEDYLDKCHAIQTGEDYDTRIEIPLDIPDKDLLYYMKAAHKLDITFNEFVNRALRELINSRQIENEHTDKI